MALIRSFRISTLLRQFCVQGGACPDVYAGRNTSTNAHNAERVKLDLQEDHALDSSAIKALPMRYYYNRNPRSPELLGIAEKPRGFATKKMRVDYYHRLMVDVSLRHISAYVNHNNGFKVVEASTKEFCISRHLYTTKDICAAFNIGRVIATRCQDAGIARVTWQRTRETLRSEKVVAFIKGVLSEGLVLNEPKVKKHLPMPGSLPRY